MTCVTPSSDSVAMNDRKRQMIPMKTVEVVEDNISLPQGNLTSPTQCMRTTDYSSEIAEESSLSNDNDRDISSIIINIHQQQLNKGNEYQNNNNSNTRRPATSSYFSLLAGHSEESDDLSGLLLDNNNNRARHYQDDDYNLRDTSPSSLADPVASMSWLNRITAVEFDDHKEMRHDDSFKIEFQRCAWDRRKRKNKSKV